MKTIEKILFNGLANEITEKDELTRIDAAFRHNEKYEMICVNMGDKFAELAAVNECDDISIKEEIIGLSVVIDSKMNVMHATLITCIYDKMLGRYRYLPQQNICRADNIKLSQLTDGKFWFLPLIYTNEGGMWKKLIKGTYNFYNAEKHLSPYNGFCSDEFTYVSPKKVLRKFNNDELISIDWANKNENHNNMITNDLNEHKRTKAISRSIDKLSSSLEKSANTIGQGIVISGKYISQAIDNFTFESCNGAYGSGFHVINH